MNQFPSQSPAAAAGPATQAFIDRHMAKMAAKGGPPMPPMQGPPMPQQVPPGIPLPPSPIGDPGGFQAPVNIPEPPGGPSGDIDPSVLAQLLGGSGGPGVPAPPAQAGPPSQGDPLMAMISQLSAQMGISPDVAMQLVMQQLQGPQPGSPPPGPGPVA